jgi:hypothetical protein
MGKGRAGYFKPMKMRPCLFFNQPKPRACSFRHSEAATCQLGDFRVESGL